MSPHTRSNRRAFTLIELLVVIAIIAMLIGVLLPSLAGARNEGRRVKCLTNLQSIGQGMAAYAADSLEGHLIPVHPEAEAGWTFDGEYEYGGGPSTIGGFLGRIYREAFGPPTRQLNKFLYGEVSHDTKFDLFRCPGDTGIPDAPKLFDPALPNDVPMVDICGNSYRVNNHIRMYTDRFFYGPYLRTASRIPDTGTTVLVGETIAQVAVYNPPPFIAPGWHQKPMRYNMAFADGHATTISIQGGNEPPREDFEGYWLFRGDGWRLDCWPDPPIRDRF